MTSPTEYQASSRDVDSSGHFGIVVIYGIQTGVQVTRCKSCFDIPECAEYCSGIVDYFARVMRMMRNMRILVVTRVARLCA